MVRKYRKENHGEWKGERTRGKKGPNSTDQRGDKIKERPLC